MAAAEFSLVLDLEVAPFRGVIAGEASGVLRSLLVAGLRGAALADGSEELDGVAAAFFEGVPALLVLTDCGLAGAACLVSRPALRHGPVLRGELLRPSCRLNAPELVALCLLSAGNTPRAGSVSIGPSAESFRCWFDPVTGMLELEAAIPIVLECIAPVRSAGGDTQMRR
mmetsp:Transcript_66131/g.123392  ORF Transcript_66131/g.123392 Transcript_66131/m.123392 type:complete len:170 (-) Transcript_66131:254-763(-)